MEIHSTHIQTVAPLSEPLSLSEAKAHLRVDDTDSDTLIMSLIIVARELVEEWTRRQILTASWRFSMDRFPRAGYWYGDFGYRHSVGVWDRHRTNAIYLPRPPVQSITSFTYVDLNGVTQTLAGGSYQFDTDSEPARLCPLFGTSWPGAKTVLIAVQITYVAGWMSPPERVKQLIRLLISDMFENRVPVGSNDLSAYSKSAQSLVASLRWGDYR